MLDFGWSEIFVIAVIALIVVGPKELPKILRTIGKAMTTMRKLAGEFQDQVRDAMREAELDEVRKSVEDLKSLNPANQIKDTIKSVTEPVSDVAKSVKDDVESAKRDIGGAVTADTPKPAPPDPSAAAGPSVPNGAHDVAAPAPRVDETKPEPAVANAAPTAARETDPNAKTAPPASAAQGNA